MNDKGLRSARIDTQLTQRALVLVFFNRNRLAAALLEDIYRTHLDALAAFLYADTFVEVDFDFNELSHQFRTFSCCF
jgi:hypothetical protein